MNNSNKIPTTQGSRGVCVGTQRVEVLSIARWEASSRALWGRRFAHEDIHDVWEKGWGAGGMSVAGDQEDILCWVNSRGARARRILRRGGDAMMCVSRANWSWTSYVGDLFWHFSAFQKNKKGEWCRCKKIGDIQRLKKNTGEPVALPKIVFRRHSVFHLNNIW